MAKGSQLSQLKVALSQAGITGNQNKGKKRKRSAAPTEKDRAKKAARLDEIHRKLNPFDIKVTKLKHDVGGRKIKGAVGKPAQSRLVGIEQRKKTLLKEYEDRNHAGGIIDRRFGENDSSMSLEEKMLERFTRERQRAAKSTAFNLEDEDELTHYGQSLSNLDDFDEVGLRLDEDEEEESGQINKDVVHKTHFGGFEDGDEDEQEEEPDRKKTKAEVMAEVISKSKEHKLLRQMEREKDDSIRQKLDEEFDSLRGLLYATPATTIVDGTQTTQVAASNSSGEARQTPEDRLVLASQDGDYDQHVRELAFDKRSKPKDRTKTEEELALEQKEALEKAERRRRRRMLGLDESDSEGEGKTDRKRKREGDDLEDDFEIDGEAWSGLGTGLGEEVSSGGNVTVEESDEGDGDEESEGEAEGEEGEQEESVASSESKRGKTKEQQVYNSKRELPYTFPCPETHDDFLEIIEEIGEDDVPIVIQRIRALHHTSLAPENKLKLQAMTAVLIDHILHVTASQTPRFQILPGLLSHLAALVKAYPTPSAEYFVKKLVLMQKNLKHGLSQGPLNLESKTWPGLSELILLRVVGALWPTSDLNHPVISPARILMGSYLGLCRVRSLADLASGLFLCTLFIHYESLSKRFVPEAINFVINTVLHLAPHGYESSSALPGSFPSPDFRSELCQKLVISMEPGEVTNPRRADLPKLLAMQEWTEQAKVDLLTLSLDLLGRYADLYKGLDGFIDLYEPILKIVRNINILGLEGLQVSYFVFNLKTGSPMSNAVAKEFATGYAYSAT
ncbi:hypothetical protein AX15_007212 [Amanita polypyramis BW_CC]|nr:hypothetical protein AX15_007212 [Amanita polypyramis BW_CC]